jgi:hypothetical protein
MVKIVVTLAASPGASEYPGVYPQVSRFADDIGKAVQDMRQPFSSAASGPTVPV